MPVLTFEGPKLTAKQKEALIKELTDALVRIVPDVPKSAYYVFIYEHEQENVGVGGVVLHKYLASQQKGD
jgi:4-oxalocrotonate tautomerase family enzyme